MSDPRHDGESAPLYPDLPEDVEGLSDETLDELLAQMEDLIGRVAARDADLIGDRPAAEVVAETKKAAAGYKSLKEERDKRDAQAAELEEELDRIVGDMLPPAPQEEPVAEPVAEEEEVVEEEPKPEPVAASGRRRALPARRRENTPQPAPATTLTASASGAGFNAGERLSSMLDVARLMVSVKERLGFAKTGDKVPIATMHRPVDERFVLRAGDHGAMLSNQQKIDAVVAPTALTAAGICVMPEARYEIETFGIADEPVRDSIPTFNADRGGISWYPPVAFSEITTAIGVVTNAEAIAGGSNALKTCQTIPCPPTSTAVVDSRYQCVEIDNLEARTFPERIAAFLANLNVARAQLGETDALAEIDAGTIAIAVTGVMGAFLDLLGVLTIQAASIRSQFRLGPRAPLRVILPSWIWDYLLQDVYRMGYDAERLALTRASMQGAIRDIGLNITETLDSQLIVQAGAGGTITWPGNVVMRMFPEGSYLRLDSGALDIGLVRDSLLNQRNAYQMFAETWEKIVFVGLQGMSRKITVTTRPTGLSGTGENTGATFATPTY